VGERGRIIERPSLYRGRREPLRGVSPASSSIATKGEEEETERRLGPGGEKKKRTSGRISKPYVLREKKKRRHPVPRRRGKKGNKASFFSKGKGIKGRGSTALAFLNFLSGLSADGGKGRHSLTALPPGSLPTQKEKKRGGAGLGLSGRPKEKKRKSLPPINSP